MSPDARLSRIASLENMMTISSNTLLAMSSQLSEAEERERAFAGRGRWNQLRSMADAKNLLQHLFNIAAEARSTFEANIALLLCYLSVFVVSDFFILINSKRLKGLILHSFSFFLPWFTLQLVIKGQCWRWMNVFMWFFIRILISIQSNWWVTVYKTYTWNHVWSLYQ